LFVLTDAEPVAASVESSPPPSLTSQTARGFAWTFGGGIAGKCIAFIGQIVLAWILDRRDFAFVGMAYTVSAFAGLVQQSGVRDVLIQRQSRAPDQQNAGFWLSACLGLLSGVGTIVAIPLAVRYYHEPRLAGLLWVLAAQNLVAAVALVPEVRLTLDLRFRFLSTLTFATTVLTLGLTILMAWLGCGAYSFVIPPLIALIVRLLFCWSASHFQPALHLGFALWRNLFGESWLAVASTFFFTVVSQADYIILGRIRGEDVVGPYYWAFNLSVQTFQIIILNASAVLFPALARLTSEPLRQRNAFIRSGQAIVGVAMPATALQAVAADPGVRLLFDPKWYAAIPMLQFLSVGMMLQVAGFPSLSLMKAQGRFPALLRLSILWAVVFVLSVWAGAHFTQGIAAGVTVSQVVAVFNWLFGPVTVYIALRTIGGTWKDVASIFSGPFAATCLAGALAFGMDRAGAAAGMTSRAALAARVAAVCVVFGAAYLGLLRLFAPTIWRELSERGKMLLHRTR
jgi:PST family polysaccharide transporter